MKLKDVDRKWLKSQILRMGKPMKEIQLEIGLDNSSFCAYLSGSRTLSKNAKLLIYWYIKFKQLEINSNHINTTREIKRD